MSDNRNKTFKNKHLAILGGTGTLGQAIVSAIVKEQLPVASITIYSRDELKQLEMMDTFPENGVPGINYQLGDVRDKQRLTEVLQGIDMVIHAAAMKHVVMCEKNPQECQKTNVEGTKHVIAACEANGIEKALLISTDKAENPVGVYGSSKQEAEAIWLKANDKNQCQYGTIRLGNIIGSRGSVWEVFEKQKKTGVLGVTHEEATRFCISKDEAVDFVIDNLVVLNTEEINHPDMQAFRVMDLAKSICSYCSIEITGLRPGDKLHEELGGKSSEDFVTKSAIPF